MSCSVSSTKSIAFNPLAHVRVKQATVEDIATIIEIFGKSSKRHHRVLQVWARLVTATLAALKRSRLAFAADQAQSGRASLRRAVDSRSVAASAGSGSHNNGKGAGKELV